MITTEQAALLVRLSDPNEFQRYFGMTNTRACSVLHDLVFSTSTIAIVASKIQDARDFLSDVEWNSRHLPLWFDLKWKYRADSLKSDSTGSSVLAYSSRSPQSMIGRSYNRVVLLGLDLSNENNEKIAHVILPVIAKGNCKVDKW